MQKLQCDCGRVLHENNTQCPSCGRSMKFSKLYTGDFPEKEESKNEPTEDT